MQVSYDLLGDPIYQTVPSYKDEQEDEEVIQPLSYAEEELFLEKIPKALLDDNDNIISNYLKNKQGIEVIQDIDSFEDILSNDYFEMGNELVGAIFWTFNLFSEPARFTFDQCCLEAGRDPELFKRYAAKSLKQELIDIVNYCQEQKPESVDLLLEKLSDYVNLWHLKK